MKFIKKYGLSILLCIIISVVCFVDLSSVPKAGKANLDKLVHLSFGFILSLFVFFEETHYFRKKVSYAKIALGSFLLPILFGGFIELGQEYFTPYRTGDWMDFLYNAAGAFIGFALCLIINGKLRDKFDEKISQ